VRAALAVLGYALLGASSPFVFQEWLAEPTYALREAREAPRWGAAAADAASTRADAEPLALLAPGGPALPEPTGATPRQAPAAEVKGRGLESDELRALRLAEQTKSGDLEGLSSGLSPPLIREGTMALRDRQYPTPEGWSELRAPGLPVRPHPRVVAYLQHFTRDARGRRTFRRWLHQSGLYRDVVTQALAKHNLPPDLLAVVCVESGWQPTAVSPAGAAGLWQLMPETARAYGLSINPYVDERRGVGRATEAAVEHLSNLYDRFLSWDMALAAYNLGYQGLISRADALGRDDYWALAEAPGGLPAETAAYVPMILAVALVLSNLDRFGFDEVALASPVDTSELEVPPDTPLTTVARAAGTSLANLRGLNPELLRGTLPREGGPLSLHVPSAGWARARLMLPRLIAERDGLEDEVSEGFDWGRDEVSTRRVRFAMSSGR
jgi:membrane-bound lytic murein transglycosylase D